MSDLLSHPLIQKYFPDDALHCAAGLVLDAMQQPIKEGERCLEIEEFPRIRETSCEVNLNGLHTETLRLPNKFQPQQKKECPICHRCGEPLDKPGVKPYSWDKHGGEFVCIHKPSWATGDPVHERKECFHENHRFDLPCPDCKRETK